MNVTIPSKSGILLSAVVHEAAGPIIILCHGYRSSKESPRIKPRAEALEKAGFSTIRFDFYGCGESGGKFEDMTIGKNMLDLEAVIDYARQKFPDKKIGIFGSSLGGMVSILVGASNNNISSLCLKAPVSDFKELRDRMDDIAKWKKDGIKETKSISTGQVFKIKYSYYEDGITHDVYAAARKITQPTLVIHGDADTNVPLEQSQRLLKALGSRDKKLEVIAGAGHLFEQPEEDAKCNSLIIDWFLAAIPKNRKP